MKRMIMSIALMTALCFATGVSAQSNNVAVKACKKECMKKCDGNKVQEKAVCGKKACAKADCKKKAECAKAAVKTDCKKAAECKGKACDKMKK